MKKFLAVLMVLCLFAGFAVAEEINWADVEPTVAEAGIEGTLASVADLGVKMFIPAGLNEVELTEDDVNDGYICCLMPEDESAVVSVTYADVEGATLDDFAAYLPEAGAAEIEAGAINDIPVLTYTLPENDSAHVCMATDAGYIVEFNFAPMSDEGFAGLAAIMTASIQPE